MGERLLIVDDSDAFLAAATRLLVAEGYEVVGLAADAAAAVRQVRRLSPQFVVLDIALPDGDGFQVARQISAHKPAPVVVLVSSRDWSDLPQRVRAAGAAGFLPKERLCRETITRLVGDR